MDSNTRLEEAAREIARPIAEKYLHNWHMDDEQSQTLSAALIDCVKAGAEWQAKELDPQATYNEGWNDATKHYDAILAIDKSAKELLGTKEQDKLKQIDDESVIRQLKGGKP